MKAKQAVRTLSVLVLGAAMAVCLSSCFENKPKKNLESAVTIKATNTAPPKSEVTAVIGDEDFPKEQTPESYNEHAQALIKKGDFGTAVENYNRAIAANPKEVRYYNNRGLAYAHLKNFDMAITDFTNAIEIDPKDPQFVNNRAIVYFQKGDYDKSWADVHKKEALGRPMNSRFLALLKLASNRDE